MLTCSDKVEILSLNLVHHRIHLCEAHNSGNNLTSNHKRRYAVCEASINHEISCISYNCGMKSRYIAHKIVETISCYLSCTVKIYTIKCFHYICVIRNLKIRNYRLTITCDFYILAVILTDRNAWVNDVRNNHHYLLNLLLKLSFLLLKLSKSCGIICHLLLDSFCLFLPALSHKSANLL